MTGSKKHIFGIKIIITMNSGKANQSTHELNHSDISKYKEKNDQITERKLSVVIACYKDAGSIMELYSRLIFVLSKVTADYEIIFVNDASPDNAEEILTDLHLKNQRVVVVNHTRNFGSQNAFLSGMKVAKGDAIILMDGDLQDPPSLIPDLVSEWLEGNDIVYGDRVKRIETVFRQYSYKIFYRIFRKLASFDLPVDAGDFGLIDRKVVNILLNSFSESEVFLRGLRAYTGFKSVGVPYVRDARFDGVTTNSLVSNIRWAKLAIFSFSRKPLEIIFYMSLIAVIVTGGMGFYYLGGFLFGYRSPPTGFMTLLMSSLFIGSVQLLCLGILAEYLGHIYSEVKKRPRYLVKNTLDLRELDIEK